MKIIDKCIRNLERNKLRQYISYVNWRYYRADLVKRLEKLSEQFNRESFIVSVKHSSHASEKAIEGSDTISIGFFLQTTWISYRDDNQLTIDYETGAILYINHSDVGFESVFISPAKSKQSGADHKVLMIYHNQHGKEISNKDLGYFIRCLCLYHQYTSVLIKNTPMLRLKVMLLKLRSYYYEYFEQDKRFKYFSGVYIPLASFVVSIIALVVAMKIT